MGEWQLAARSHDKLRMNAKKAGRGGLVLVEPLEKVLADAGEGAGEVWLWCIECTHFFQAKDLRADYRGNKQGCAFCRCAGFNVAIHLWNTFRSKGWPKRVQDLRHGMTAW